jgi:hypothetical protein
MRASSSGKFTRLETGRNVVGAVIAKGSFQENKTPVP